MTERFAAAMQLLREAAERPPLLPIFAPAGPSLSAPDLPEATETRATASAHVVPMEMPAAMPPRPADLLGRLRRVMLWLSDAIEGVS